VRQDHWRFDRKDVLYARRTETKRNEPSNGNATDGQGVNTDLAIKPLCHLFDAEI
jgi:hypothetical protein